MSNESVTGHPWRRHQLAIGVLLLLLPWAVFLPSLSGDFVFDDVPGIVQNPAVQGFEQVGRMVRFWEPSDVSYRPLRYFSYAVDWVRGGGSPAAFHQTNLLLHGLGAVAFYALLVLVLPDRRLAPWAALLWLVHPLQVEAVAYIAGRKDLLCSLFYFTALLGQLLRLRADSRTGRVLGSVAFLWAGLLAFLAKEMALTLPLAAFVLDVLLRPGKGLAVRARAALAAGRVFYGLIALVGLVGLVDKLILAPGTKIPFDLLSDPLRNLPLALKSVAFYLRKTVWPWPLVGDLRGLFPVAMGELRGWGPFWNGGSWPGTLAGLGVGAALLLGTRRRAGGPLVRASLLLYLVAVLPVANLVPLNEPAAEHFAHLPLAPLVVALTVAAALLPVPRGRPALVLAVAVVALLGVSSHLRSRVWRDAPTLWTSVLTVNDGCERAWNNLGLVRLEAGDRTGARRAFERSLAVAAIPQPRTYANLIQTLRDDGDLAAALGVARDAVRRHPDDPLVLSLAGGVLVEAGQAAAARPLLDRVAPIPGGERQAASTWRRDRGLAHLLTDDPAGGEQLLLEAAQADPADASVLATLGWFYLQQDRLGEAESALARAVALPGASAIAWRNRAVALLRLDRAAEAAAALDQAEALGDEVPPSLRHAVNAAGGGGEGRP